MTLRVVKPTTVSLVAQQRGGSFTSYATKTGNISLLRTGVATAPEMFDAAQQANTVLTWILRFAGVLLMTVGFRMILGPLSVLADVLPVLGNLVEKGVGGLSLAIALPISLVTIAVGWVFYRPLLGITLLALAAGGAFLPLAEVPEGEEGDGGPASSARSSASAGARELAASHSSRVAARRPFRGLALGGLGS